MGSSPSILNSMNPGYNLTSKSGLRRGLGDQYGINQGLENQTNTSRSSEMGTLLPGYQSMAQGGTAADNNALEQSVLTPLRGSFNAARTAGASHVARTGNSAGFGSMLGETAREEGRQSSQAGFDIANEKFRRKMAGLQGLSQMYGIDSSFLNSLGNQQLGVLGVGNSIQSRSRGVLGNINAGLNLVGLGS